MTITTTRRNPYINPRKTHLFKGTPTQRIGLLSRKDTEKLITEPAKGALVYNQDSIQAILALSKGHPYVTQLICYALFVRARSEEKQQVTAGDVEEIVDNAIEIGEGGLALFRDGLPIPERVIFSAVAEAQNRTGEDRVAEPAAILKEYGVVETESLRKAKTQLVAWDFFDFVEGFGYRVKVELVRRWLVQQHPLKGEIWQLEQLLVPAERVYQSGTEVQGYQLWKNAISLYEQALSINPNHFNALFKLAEVYLEVGDFSKAVELYQRAYQVDSNRAQEGYVQSLQDYGLKLVQQREFKLAKYQFRQVLRIEPDNLLAQEKLQEFETYIDRIAELRLQIMEMQSELKNKINNQAFYYKRYTKKSMNQINILFDIAEALILKISKKLPNSEFQPILDYTKLGLYSTSVLVNNDKFSKAKETLEEVVDRIKKKLREEESNDEAFQTKAEARSVGSDISNPSINKSKSTKIFISYYDRKILQGIETVLGTLGGLAPEIDKVEPMAVKQSNNLETVSKIEYICSCASAIFCFPPQNSPEDSSNSLAYLDLGICLALFPESTLVIYSGNQLPEDLVSKVETFEYLGDLDFQQGMKLAGKILSLLRKGS